MSSLKNLFVAMVVMASLCVGGAAWACGPYGLSPEQQVQNQLLLVQSMIKHQRGLLDQALQQGQPQEAEHIQQRLAQLEARRVLVQHELLSLRLPNPELALQLQKLQKLQQQP